MTSALAAGIAGAANSGATLRTGTVAGISGTAVTVDVGGGQMVDMPHLIAYQPILGDVVQILQQGPANLVLDRVAAISGNNALANPSFEIDPPGTAGATSWTAIRDPAATSPIVITTRLGSGWGAADGSQWIEFAATAAGGDAGMYLTSEPIPVSPGEQWTAAAYVTAAGNTAANTAQLRLAWFDTSAPNYPATIAPDHLIGSVSFPVGVYPAWFVLRHLSGNGVAVPDGVQYMRVVLSVEIFDVGWVYADAVCARRIPGAA